jgi:hypothetical protein
MEKLVQMPLKDEDLLDRIEALVSPDEVVAHGRLRVRKTPFLFFCFSNSRLLVTTLV